MHHDAEAVFHRGPTLPQGLASRRCTDQLRKGAALNAIPIAEDMHCPGLLLRQTA